MKLPSRVLDALDAYQGTRLNFRAISALQQARKASGLVGETLLKYQHDLGCILAIGRQGFVPQGDTFGVYVPAYKVSTTGRLFQLGGGLQAATRELKAAAYAGLAAVRNYDLKDSQLVCLLHVLREAQGQGLRVDVGFLEDYLAEPEAKQLCAASVGISPGCWKDLLYGLLMGASVHGPSVKEALLQDGVPPEMLSARLEALEVVTAPLRQTVQAWYGHLRQRLPAAPRTVKGRYWRNACGALYHFEADWQQSGHKVLRRLAAHQLQGLERAFIRELELGASTHGFSLQSNEHDGLVVMGMIPETLVARARAKLKLQDAQLVEKPFG